MNKISQNKPSFWSFGRMRRTTYALLSIPAIFILIIVRIGMESVIGSSIVSYDVATLFFITIIELIPFYFLVFIGIKRLHDCDYKGWWVLIPLVICAIWFVRPTKGENRFGFDPRDDYYDDDTEFESDYSFFGIIAITLIYNFAVISQITNS